MATLSKCFNCGKVFSCNGNCDHDTTQNCMCCFCWGGSLKHRLDLDRHTRLKVFRQDICERVKYLKYNPSKRFNPSMRD